MGSPAVVSTEPSKVCANFEVHLGDLCTFETISFHLIMSVQQPAALSPRLPFLWQS